jgi:hypothetical protein
LLYFFFGVGISGSRQTKERFEQWWRAGEPSWRRVEVEGGEWLLGEAHYASQTATLRDRRIGSGESFIKNNLKARSGTPALKGAT